mmetsp:Transcript_17174/g.42843  ORF Transcript_17174/g.42843 Transcript_17174/m.42843 type:complete len:220 (-) Transcript_17174:71-730(-)
MVVDFEDLLADLFLVFCDPSFVLVPVGSQNWIIELVRILFRRRIHQKDATRDRIGQFRVIRGFGVKIIRCVVFVVPNRKIQIKISFVRAPSFQHVQRRCFAIGIDGHNQSAHLKDVIMIGDPFRKYVVVVLDEQTKGRMRTITDVSVWVLLWFLLLPWISNHILIYRHHPNNIFRKVTDSNDDRQTQKENIASPRFLFSAIPSVRGRLLWYYSCSCFRH